MRRINIIQGEHCVVSEPDTMVTTLLGSCIAVCLNDSVSRIGGMNHFLLGETLPAALRRAESDWRTGYTHSFDMLGEAALTGDDSRRYFAAYREAIDIVGASVVPPGLPHPNVSIKLSALHPRYVSAQWPLLQRELIPELCALCEFAAARQVAIARDAGLLEPLAEGLLLQAAGLPVAEARPLLLEAVELSQRQGFAELQGRADTALRERALPAAKPVTGRR